MSDPDTFLKKAKQSVINVERQSGDFHIQTVDLYVVWFAKVLGNWKALVSTDVYDGSYWEVTYNGNKQETYVDTYSKISNVALPDSEQ